MATNCGFRAWARIAGLSALMGVACPAAAADGRTAINQNKALTGKVTPGDAAGFPVTLTRPGSYVLTSNLSVPDNKDGIVIAASGVTLDLNGFRITGTGFGTGIHDGDVNRRGVAIRDGTISNFNIGVRLIASTEIILEGLRAFDNYDAGIAAGLNSIVRNNVVSQNGYVGLRVFAYSLVEGNVVQGTTSVGLYVDCPSSVLGNSASTIQLDLEGCTAANNTPAP